MGRDLGIPDRLNDQGLKVREVAGWQTRGSSYFNPRGSVTHHTAGPRSGTAPSLGVVTNGRPGIPGPLANVLQARDNTIYVVAAGRANHAGRGGWNGLTGNSSVYGNEVENTGYASGSRAEPWRPDQIETMAKVAAALDPDAPELNHCLHKEWAPARKIDPHSINGNVLRQMIQAALNNPSPVRPPTDPTEPEETQVQLVRFDPAQGGDDSIIAVWGMFRESVNRNDPDELNRWLFITGGLANVSNQDVAGWNFINRITWDISTIGRTLLQVVQNGQAIQGVSQQINSIPQSGRSVVVDSDAISTAVVEELSQRLQT